jgi:hypothetical protein
MVAVVVGMIVGYSGKKPSASAGGGAGRPIVDLRGLTRSDSPTTTSPPATESTTSSTAAPSTTAPPTGATTKVLQPNTTGAGPKDLPSFTAGASWSIGWHFRCVAAPGGSAAFTVDVIPGPGGAAAGHAVEQAGNEAQGVSPQSTAGTVHLRVTTDPACQWAVKVTGVAT